ncbi:MAG: restriction endonuclease subunit S [Anaerostipes sp.]
MLNDNLMQQTMTLYDYWFTQYDFPDDYAKPYKSSGGQMVRNNQAKQDIPLGWKVTNVQSIINNICTGLNPRDNFILGNGNIKYVTVKNLTTNGTLNFSGCDTISEDARAIVHRRSDIKIGDILFASIAPLGRCYLILNEPFDWDINESVFSIRPNEEFVSPEYLYMFFMSDSFIKGATSSSTGSIFKGIRINTLMDTMVILPPRTVVDRFTREINKLLSLKSKLTTEMEHLVNLRDWLLPMLMNGQATVDN